MLPSWLDLGLILALALALVRAVLWIRSTEKARDEQFRKLERDIDALRFTLNGPQGNNGLLSKVTWLEEEVEAIDLELLREQMKSMEERMDARTYQAIQREIRVVIDRLEKP